MQPVDQVKTAAALLILGAMAWRTWAAVGAWFYADDFLLLETARGGGLTGSMLLTPNDSQLMPLGMAIAWLVGMAPGLTWWPAAVSLIVMQAAALASCYWLLRTMIGDRWLMLVPLGLFAFSPMAMDNSLWWAAALNGLPAQTAFFLLLTAAIARSRERRWRWALSRRAPLRSLPPAVHADC